MSQLVGYTRLTKQITETDVNKLNDDADENEPPRKRALWSDNTSGPREWRERHMFPNECFICHSVKMKPYKFTGKRLVVRLMRCEIVNGGKDIRIVYPVGCSTGQAGMKPMKWISNSKTLLEGIPKEHRAKSVDKTRQRLPSTKTLGLTWHAESDKFQLKKPVMVSNVETLTKQIVLSKLSSVFDPLGIIGPIIVVAKI
ncbi:hypothetical protein BSL78_07149 [Apostichopus japonicus]|uniref:Uncharacterized protein n=1 Tax=Stichopus japonicus TaxID=307972 RepID=A0A2G8JPX9_STIJA|nr:hypothetical protein BSL78_25331 [Apostichopus japonicus]PIK55953.1 hypothetical protein BSL78_07149 [Apostichopus japonicus]